MANQQLVEETRQLSNGKMPWWLVGILSTILLSAGTAWLHAVQAGEETLQSLQRNQAERVAVLEHEIADVRERLQRIEQKLDRAINRP